MAFHTTSRRARVDIAESALVDLGPCTRLIRFDSPRRRIETHREGDSSRPPRHSATRTFVHTHTRA